MVEGVEPEITGRPGPGADLRAARERQGLDLRDVARSLRLDRAVIVALEADDFDRLPAPIFVKGYLGAYCKLLGLAPDSIISAYERAAGDVAPPPLVVSRGTGDGAGGRPLAAVVIGMFLAVVLGSMVYLALTARGGGDENRAMRSTAPETVAPTIPPPVVRPREDPVPEAVPEAVPGDEEAVPEPDITAPMEASADEAPPVPGNIRVQLRFLEDSWTEVTDADGNRLFFDLARAGRVVEVEGRAPFDIFLGNGPGVAVFVDGEPFDHRPYNRAGNVARFSLDPRP